MYKLVDSFMDWNHYTGEDSYKGHLVNVEAWFKTIGNLTELDGEFQVCVEANGYGYFYGDLITFSEAVNGMVEYKVWRDYSE